MPLSAVPLFAQCPDGSPPPCTGRAAGPAPSVNSVGVMQFSNLARDTASAYLGEGLAAEIATSLARVPRLEVRSPSAVRSAQRGADTDLRTIGRRLNVRHIVEGEFQRGGDRIRISVRLVSLPSGTQRWSEAFTRPAADLLAVQEEIATAVATAIAGQLLPQERSVLTRRPTRSTEAYDRFIRANVHLARRTPAGVSRAIDEYGEALRLDPSFVQAAARIALAYALYLDWGWDFPGLSPDSQRRRGLAMARQALQLDSLSADGWMSLGYLLAFEHPRTLEGVLASLRRATELDPANAEAWHQYGSWLTGVGRYDEAIAAMSRALALEPGRAVSFLQRAQVHEIARRDTEALADYDSAIAVDQEFYVAYFNRAFVRLRRGDSAGASADADAAMRTSPPSEAYYGLAALAAVAAHRGDSAAARAFTARAIAPFANRPLGPIVAQTLAFGLMAVGDQRGAVDVLERSSPHGALLWWNSQYQVFEPLLRDPRFAALMEQNRPPELPR